MDVVSFTVGPVQENSYVLRRSKEATTAVIVDPGDEADKLLAAIEDLGVTLDAILLTHTHFDHVGAVAPVARATGAPVYCPVLETQILAHVMDYVPWPGFGPFEDWVAEETVAGGERLRLAGFEIDVVFTPGHSPGHVTYAFLPDPAFEDVPTVLASGDVLFQPKRMPITSGLASLRPTMAPSWLRSLSESAIAAGRSGFQRMQD